MVIVTCSSGLIWFGSDCCLVVWFAWFLVLVVLLASHDLSSFDSFASWYVFANAIKGKNTRGIDTEAWAEFFADLDRLANGVGADGEPLYIDEFGHRWGGILPFGGGDMEQLVHWGIKSYNDIDELCGFCEANRSDRPFTDNLDTAGWRPTEDNMTNEVRFTRTVLYHPNSKLINWSPRVT